MDKTNNKLPGLPGLGKVRQMGIVVRSVPRAVEFYAKTFGIGPWYRPKFSSQEHYHEGERPVQFDLDLAIAFAGKIQYEIIEHKGGDRNIYCDHIEKHGEGIHHLGFYVNDFERRLAAYREAGIGVLQAGVLTSGGKGGGSKTKYAYLDTRAIGGVIFEIIETRFLTMDIQMSPFWFGLGAIMGDVERIHIG
jgi:catechol 2,3-dioxygenase-like lactoylglutathione lyase family enzyme